MFKNYTYKQKNRLLLVAAVLFLLPVYFGAVKKTWQMYHSSTELEKKLLHIEDSPRELAIIEKKLRDLDYIFGKTDSSFLNYQPYILQTVSEYCNAQNIVLNEFPEPVIYQEQDFVVETNKITVEGDFIDLLNLSYLLEQKKKLGRISSLQFKSFNRNIDNKKETYLSSTIYLQHLIPQKNEK